MPYSARKRRQSVRPSGPNDRGGRLLSVRCVFPIERLNFIFWRLPCGLLDLSFFAIAPAIRVASVDMSVLQQSDTDDPAHPIALHANDEPDAAQQVDALLGVALLQRV